jgi:extradiol dioxygenase family protein
MKDELRPFHLAIPVDDIATNRKFYREVLGCVEGRSSEHWVDFNFFGHQLVIHHKAKLGVEKSHSNPVDGKEVPVPHFGVILDLKTFEYISERIKEHHIDFIIEPYTRFEGEVGEQATLFIKDPAGNAIEFKAFKNLDQLFEN